MSSSDTKVLIFGSGAIGSVYGYMLHRGGASVTAVCRSNYEAIHTDGITIHSELWGTVHYRPRVVRTVDEASQQGPFDFIVVCSKAFTGTCKLIAPAVTPNAAIVLAQNGIGIEQEYVDMYPAAVIISGVVWLPATQTAPSVVAMGPRNELKLGVFPPSADAAHHAKVQRFAALLIQGGGDAPVYEDIQAQRWAKLAVNVAFNPMCALSRCDSANLMRSSDMADGMVVDVLKEVRRIAAAAGYDVLGEDEIDSIMSFHRGLKETGGKDPSMLADVKAGRPMEVEAILGNAMRIGRKHGVVMPYVEMLYCLANALDFSIVRPDTWKPPVF